MRWQFQRINLFSLGSLSSLSVADISFLYHSGAQPPITEPHKPLLNVYIVTLQTSRHFLTHMPKKSQHGVTHQTYERIQTRGGRLKLHQDPKWPQLYVCVCVKALKSNTPASCFMVSFLTPLLLSSPEMCASLSRSSPALIRNISLWVTVLFQCL